jgi:hypothetical protein
MAHHLTTADPSAANAQGERPAAYNAAKPGWHQLGTVLDRPVSVEEAKPYLVDVTTEPLLMSDGLPTGHHAIRRVHGPDGGPGPCLTVVGSQFKLEDRDTMLKHVQNFGARMQDPTDPAPVLGIHDPVFSTALSLREGSEWVVSVALGEGTDDGEYSYFATLILRHGTGVREVLLSGIRPVCANTVAFAISSATERLKVAHRQTVTSQTQNMLTEFTALMATQQAFTGWLQRLESVRVSHDQVTKLFQDLMKSDDGKGRKGAAVDYLVAAYTEAPGAMPGNARGIVEAVTNWGTHRANVKARTTGAQVLGGSVDAKYRAQLPGGTVQGTIVQAINMIGELTGMTPNPVLVTGQRARA